MLRTNRKPPEETIAGFAIAVLMTNVLIILILCGVVWAFASLKEQFGSSGLLFSSQPIYK